MTFERPTLLALVVLLALVACTDLPTGVRFAAPEVSVASIPTAHLREFKRSNYAIAW